MEIIKKTIKLKMTTGSTVQCIYRDPETGDESIDCENRNCECYLIIPDTGVTYNIKILLKNEQKDLGYFDVDADPLITGFTGTNFNHVTTIITGESTSRLSELKKFKTGDGISTEFYFGGGGITTDGVDFAATIPNVSVVYYIGGIKYIDDLIDGITYFEFTSLGYDSPNFIDLPYYKIPSKENIVSMPKIDDDVFIDRGEISILENNYRLEQIDNLGELTTYAGGSLFNIVNNT